MKTGFDGGVRYWLKLDSEIVAEITQLVGQRMELTWTGGINCVNCGKSIKKTFGEGFCYDCFSNAAAASPCIIRPELCEAHLGKGRDVTWEQENHNQPHFVYLAQTNGIKVGITRESNIPSRWLDQGAWKAIVFAKVPYRRLAGEIEVELKQYISDRTDYRKMLTNMRGDENMVELAITLGSFLPSHLQGYLLRDQKLHEFEYPVLQYPQAVNTIKLESEPFIDSTLMGIRGQYFLFEDGRALNIRKYSGYEVGFRF